MQTIQGEGHWVGLLVDFIRLAGCPVGCWFCDTGYAKGAPPVKYDKLTIQEITDRLKTKQIVISGGEPLIHRGILGLIDSLLAKNYRVYVETSGSHWQDLPESVWITLSPKEHISQYPTDDRFWARANEIKIVISTGQELEYYASRIKNTTPVFLQPEWTHRDRTIPLTLEIQKHHPTVRLSLQIHKIIGLP